MRICADRGKGELGHRRLADDDRAGLAKAANDDSIALSRRSTKADRRAGNGRLAGDIEQILNREDFAVESPERHTRPAPCLSSIRSRACRFRIDFREDALLVATGRKAGKDVFDWSRVDFCMRILISGGGEDGARKRDVQNGVPSRRAAHVPTQTKLGTFGPAFRGGASSPAAVEETIHQPANCRSTGMSEKGYDFALSNDAIAPISLKKPEIYTLSRIL